VPGAATGLCKCPRPTKARAMLGVTLRGAPASGGGARAPVCAGRAPSCDHSNCLLDTGRQPERSFPVPCGSHAVVRHAATGKCGTGPPESEGPGEVNRRFGMQQIGALTGETQSTLFEQTEVPRRSTEGAPVVRRSALPCRAGKCLRTTDLSECRTASAEFAERSPTWLAAARVPDSHGSHCPRGTGPPSTTYQ
jgi:hypothetical protein